MDIITQDAYTYKVHTLLTIKNFSIMPNYPTIMYHNLLQKTLRDCNLLIDKKKKIKYLLQKKPSPPTLRVRIKLYKQDKSIRSVVNNMKAPSYKIAKHLIHTLNTHLNLRNIYNVTKSTQLALELSRPPSAKIADL
jgi:hypothetical protein